MKGKLFVADVEVILLAHESVTQHTTFINYLRICMGGCGFARAEAAQDFQNFVEYWQKVKPLLKPI